MAAATMASVARAQRTAATAYSAAADLRRPPCGLAQAQSRRSLRSFRTARTAAAESEGFRLGKSSGGRDGGGGGGGNASQQRQAQTPAPPPPGPRQGRTLLYTAALTAAAGLFAYLRTSAERKAGGSSPLPSSSPRFSPDDVSLLCFIGFPQSGKTTQAKNTETRWQKEGWQSVQGIDSVAALRDVIERRREAARGKRLSLIVDGFPRSLEEAKDMERKVCPVFCYAYFAVEEDEWTKKTGRSANEYKTLYEKMQPLRETAREKGNILEMVAMWPQNEVWEQVEAKVEQVLELREMGEM